MINLDDILKDVGEFGPYQKRVFALVCTMVFSNSWMSMITVFLAASMDHWCKVASWEDFDCSAYDLDAETCKEEMKVASIPANYSADGQLVYEQCQMFNVSGVPFTPHIDPTNYNSRPYIPCPDGWVYDTSQYKSSIVSEFDLVCGSEDLTDVSQSVFYGGYLAGSIIFGTLGDLIGRWKTLMLCHIIRLITGVAMAFSPSWWVFTVIRFFQGVASISTFIITFIIGTEFVGPSKRSLVGLLFNVPFSFGYMTLALIAYFIPYWKTLELVVTSAAVFYIAIMFLLPESVRWQISVRKYDKAEVTLAKIARANKKPVPDRFISEEDIKKLEEAPKERPKTGFDLFRTPRMRIRTINLIFLWMVNSLVYHGLSLNTSNLGVNDYVAFAVSGAVETPAYILASFLVDIIGRKYSLASFLLSGGVACLCTSFIPPGVALTVVAMIGKFGIAASFGTTYLFTAELFPTDVRGAAIGTCSMFSRVAGIIAPLILTLDKIWQPLPLVIYGASSVAAGLLSFFYPETRGRQLPVTMEEAENFRRRQPSDGSETKEKYAADDCDNVEDTKEITKEKKGALPSTDFTNPVFTISDELALSTPGTYTQIDLDASK
ncbi:organic cation transporter protein-like [Diadema setosum]|uniref:organic cation transporter protein-like n=1 Tax=Diadema setosum TaxID=31175 RepID=UPI003B3A674C